MKWCELERLLMVGCTRYIYKDQGKHPLFQKSKINVLSANNRKYYWVWHVKVGTPTSISVDPIHCSNIIQIHYCCDNKCFLGFAIVCVHVLIIVPPQCHIFLQANHSIKRTRLFVWQSAQTCFKF